MTTTTRPALSTLAVSYELSIGARDHLGADGLAIWSDALRAELERRFPDCAVEVDSRWSSVDASRYEVTGETAEGAPFAGSKAHLGAFDTYPADADAEWPTAALSAIADAITTADQDAWERACEAAAEVA